MKLYNKKLNSLEQLHREKVLLRYRRRQTDKADLNPLTELGRGKVTPAAKEGLLGTVMQLAGAGSSLELAMALGKPLLGLLRKRKRMKTQPVYRDDPKPSKVKKVIQGIVLTFVIGKAVQMAVRYAGMYRRRRALEAVTVRR